MPPHQICTIIPLQHHPSHYITSHHTPRPLPVHPTHTIIPNPLHSSSQPSPHCHSHSLHIHTHPLAMARDASDVQLSEVDVVVVALQPSLSFLASWRELLQGCHVIVVQGEDFPGVIRVPEGFENVDVYTRATMARVLGPELLRALPFTGNGSRGFGYLVARRRYVFTMEPGCVPAEDPEGYVVNPVVEHVLNLKTPATPFFFNTLYDPFREGADFVRGYPFSLREGVPTAISQGAWTSSSAARYVDAVLTVPKFVLYTASGINLAFDRHLVGPLMFEPPELGFGGELWAGLCAKTVCDLFPWGVKTGLPYVCRSEKAAALADDARTDRFDVIAQFFQATKLSGNPVDVAGCYLEIAEQAKSKLSAVDPVFKEVASSMHAWIQAWNKLGH